MPVVDASVVVDWVAPGVDPDGPSMAASAQLAAANAELLAPRLVLEEVSNALLTGVRRQRWSGCGRAAPHHADLRLRATSETVLIAAYMSAVSSVQLNRPIPETGDGAQSTGLGCWRARAVRLAWRGMTTLVLGGTGMTGRRVVERLARAVAVAADGRSTWSRDIESVFVTVSDGSTVAALAAERRLRRLVLLSRRGDAAAVPAERAVRESGAEWTILRASLLDQCFSEGPLLEPIRRGEVALPLRPVGEPFVDAADAADVAVAALTEPGHAGRVYELTGPRLLTFAEAIEEIAAAARRPIRCSRVDAGGRRRSLRRTSRGSSRCRTAATRV